MMEIELEGYREDVVAMMSAGMDTKESFEYVTDMEDRRLSKMKVEDLDFSAKNRSYRPKSLRMETSPANPRFSLYEFDEGFDVRSLSRT